MILNATTKILKKNNGQTALCLTRNQQRFLLLLSDNQNHTHEEVCKYMGWGSNKNINVEITRLRQAAPSLKILNRKGVGTLLNTEILITTSERETIKPTKKYNKENNYLKTRLKEINMTQKEFAIRIGISETTVQRIMKKNRFNKLSIGKIYDIATVLDVTPHLLIQKMRGDNDEQSIN